MRHRFAWTLFGTSLFVAATAAAQPAPTAPPPPSGPNGAAQPLPPPPSSAQPPPNGTPPNGTPPGGTQAPPPGTPPPNNPPPGGLPPPPPGGPLPPGQPPSGQLPPGQMPPPGQLPPGQLPPGQLPPGQLPPGQLPPGQLPGPGGSNTPSGSLPPGQAPQVPWTAPPPPDVQETPGLSHGVPLSRRGAISIEAAGYTATQPDPTKLDTVVALALNVHIPIATRTFADVRLPLAGGYLPGNVMLGVDRVSKMDARGFMAYGLQIGLPLSVNRGVEAFSLPNGTWNVHEYQPHFMPLKVAFGYERMLGGSFELRVDLEPVVSIPIGDYGYNVGFTFQHAAEIQFGHSIGVGLRVQGVAITDQLSTDAYQLGIEPFAVVQREMGFARLGLMFPIDDSTAGPPFEQAWGLRLWTGLHID